jgi:hypothetical protein
MSHTPDSLATLLVRHKPACVQYGYPDWLRTEVGAYVRKYRAGGGNVTALSEVMGLSKTTLTAWSRLEAVPSKDSFVPVVVEPDIPNPTDHTIDMRAPDGFHLHRLSFDQAIEAVRRLRCSAPPALSASGHSDNPLTYARATRVCTGW